MEYCNGWQTNRGDDLTLVALVVLMLVAFGWWQIVSLVLFGVPA